MMTKFKKVNWNPSEKEKRNFGLILIIGFPFVSIFWTLLMGQNEKVFYWNWELFCWIAGIGCGIGLFSFLIPTLARPVYCLWFLLICIVDVIITMFLLPSFFYIILFPYSLLIRILKKHTLKKGPHSCKTYWNDVAPNKNNSQYYRQF